MSQQQTSSLHLDNGLRVILVSDPIIHRAAALMSIEAGSLHEPLAWPGLAHLLEHMLFRGSNRFDAEQSLMRWVPANGGRLNATTLATQTAVFFEVNSEQLEAGLARLIDMLSAPLLDPAALMQEVNIIDAEYHLLRTDANTLCEAAQYQTFNGIDALHRFHIGNSDVFGHDVTALQQALQHYHQQHYRAANMTLWVQGPQPLEQLHAMVLQLSSSLSAEPAPEPVTQAVLAVQANYRLRLPGTPLLHLTLALNQPAAVQRISLRLLTCLLLDEAEHSLQAYLRRTLCCNAVRLTHNRLGEQCALISVVFNLNMGTLHEVAAIEAAFYHWLQQLDNLSEIQLTHYQQQANQAFYHLSPLDQLREKAFGLPPVQETNCWSKQLSALLEAPLSRLLTHPAPLGASREIQGLPLALTLIEVLAKPQFSNCFHFFTPIPLPSQTIEWPITRVPLLHLQHQQQPVLQLQPVTPLSDQQGYRLQAALRMLSAQLAHHNGYLEFERFQDSWILQLSGDDALMHYGVYRINQALSALSPDMEKDAARMKQYHRLAEKNALIIRRLLSQLPKQLGGVPSANVQWQANLLGGSKILHTALSSLLSDFPYPLIATVVDGQVKKHHPSRLEKAGTENALLLFFPLPEITTKGRVALRVLAQLYAPHYFQRLRVEKNIGYVVQCAYHCSMGIEGIIFALQSPQYSPAQLNQFTHKFLDEMPYRLKLLTTESFEQVKHSLAQSLQSPSGDILREARIKSYQNPLLLKSLAEFSHQDLQLWQQRIFTPIK